MRKEQALQCFHHLHQLHVCIFDYIMFHLYIYVCVCTPRLVRARVCTSTHDTYMYAMSTTACVTAMLITHMTVMKMGSVCVRTHPCVVIALHVKVCAMHVR